MSWISTAFRLASSFGNDQAIARRSACETWPIAKWYRTPGGSFPPPSSKSMFIMYIVCSHWITVKDDGRRRETMLCSIFNADLSVR